MKRFIALVMTLLLSFQVFLTILQPHLEYLLNFHLSFRQRTEFLRILPILRFHQPYC